MNNRVYYCHLYAPIYSIGMSIPTLYDFPLEHQALINLNKDEGNAELVKKYHEASKYALTISRNIHGYKKFDVLPNSLWIDSKIQDEIPQDDEYIFMILQGAIIMRENCANVFKQCQLGESTLTPLKIYDLQTNKPWRDETFYFFNMCERRHYVCHPQSKGVLKYFEIPDVRVGYLDYGGLSDGVIDVSYDAVNSDIDIWHDPMLSGSYFMSQKLHDLMVKHNTFDHWSRFSCNLV